MRVQEEKNLAKLVFTKKLTKAEKDERMCQVGHILIESDLDRVPEEIYLLYKRRDRVEKLFETWKSTLQADRTWLRSDASVFGHVFIVPFIVPPGPAGAGPAFRRAAAEALGQTGTGGVFESICGSERGDRIELRGA